MDTSISIGTTVDVSTRCIALANDEEFEGAIFATVGIHPAEANTFNERNESLKRLRDLAKQARVVAIGECGLDFHDEYNLIIFIISIPLPTHQSLLWVDIG